MPLTSSEVPSLISLAVVYGSASEAFKIDVHFSFPSAERNPYAKVFESVHDAGTSLASIRISQKLNITELVSAVDLTTC